MTGPLTLDLFDRRFADLVELGRSRIPNLAPAWTDHNYHDPGIMLIELLAWTSEAQMYALSRMRADERLAYAALLGITPHGPLPAAGLVWPAPRAPALAGVVTPDAPVHSAKPDAPTFWPSAAILLVPAQLVGLVTHLASGEQVDHTSANRRDGAGFDPFGLHGDPGDRLELMLECDPGQHLFSGLSGQTDTPTGELSLSLGVRVRTSAADAAGLHAMPATRWDAALVSGAERWPLLVKADDSHGFAHSGALLLGIGAVPRDTPVKRFTLELRARGGFARAPRIECIELNVLPVRQSASVVHELHIGNGLPDQVLRLEHPNLRFDGLTSAVKVRVAPEDGRKWWIQQQDFASSGPGDEHFVVDTGRAEVVFGNGVNGKVPPAAAQILLDYATCAGPAGNLPRGQHWTVRGIDGAFGLNLDAMAGGAQGSNLGDLRRQARRQVTQAHALVSSTDVTEAALAAPHLRVGRAHIIDARGACAASTTLTLLAMRAPTPGVAAPVPESPRWLAALQRALAARLPLGQRLVVIGPRYVAFSVHARLVAAPQEDPAQVAAAAMELLNERLSLVAERAGATAYPLGQALSTQQVAAWLRKLPGVTGVLDFQLYEGNTPVRRQLALPRAGLPLLERSASSISVERASGRSL